MKSEFASDEALSTFSFAAMGTVCNVQCSGVAQLGERVAEVVRGLEAKWSRFLSDSEVSAINAHPGDFVTLSPETAAILMAAEHWRVATAGLFDIAYEGASSSAAGFTLSDNMVRLVPGRALDLGGIGKGAAADLALQVCLEMGAERVTVNLGSSSLALRAGEGEPWRIGIRSPWAGAPNPVGYLELSTGSISLSGTARELEPCQDWESHLMNPLTGQTARSDVALAVVVAKDGITAEALSTAVILAGSQAGLDLCTEHGVSAAVFTCDRQVLGTLDMTEILRLARRETTQSSAPRRSFCQDKVC